MTVSIVQDIVLHARTKSRTCRREVAFIKYKKSISAGSNETWTDNIVIPAVAATSNGMCKIIVVSYNLVLNVNPAGCTTSKDVPIPIVIGTIPLTDSSNTASSPFEYQNCMFGPSEQKYTPDLGEKRGDVIESNEASYAPLYPYYNYKY